MTGAPVISSKNLGPLESVCFDQLSAQVLIPPFDCDPVLSRTVGFCQFPAANYLRVHT